MENPLELPLPDDPIQRVHRLAHDLAYGAIHGMWGAKISIVPYKNTYRYHNWESKTERAEHGRISLFGKYLKEKWQSKPPSLELLKSFDYLQPEGKDNYLLTAKAFALLTSPIPQSKPKTVFISYKQSESSAFLVLVETRLKSVDPKLDIFTDALLQGGDDWENVLEKRVRESSVFICLVAPGTLESDTIQKEITWALESGSKIIPICHGGFSIEKLDHAALKGKQAISVPSENAKGYESAINDLVVSLGYSTGSDI